MLANTRRRLGSSDGGTPLYTLAQLWMDRRCAVKKSNAGGAYDTKHAAHLLRLYRMGIEILRQHTMLVLRPDAAWLKEVLNDRCTYPDLMALVADLRSELAHAEAESTLPTEPDVAAIEVVVIELHCRVLADPCFAG